MHRQFSAMLSIGGSPGKLAEFGRRLGQKNVSIETIGGAEWNHNGPIAFTVKADGPMGDDEVLDKVTEVLETLRHPWILFRSVEVTMPDDPGELGKAGKALADEDINVYSVLVHRPENEAPRVAFGVRPRDVRAAVAALSSVPGHAAVLSKHPDDPDDDGSDPPPWWDHWDDRSEALVDTWISILDDRYFMR